MRVLFVVSALLWSCLVGRLVAFGPTVYGWCWCPRFDADSWYRLTPFPCKIPHAMLFMVPFVLVVCTVPALYISNNTLHAAAVMTHASEHAFVPIFVAQVHGAIPLAIWTVTNALCNIVTIAVFYKHPLGLVMKMGLAVKCVVDIWFAYVQVWIGRGLIVREPPDYDGRSVRAMTV